MEEPILNRDFGIRNIPDNIRLNKEKKGHDFPYDGIWLFTGGQGTGKTLNLMHVVKAIHDDFPDALIVSNVSIFGIPSIPYQGIEDFYKYNNGRKGIIFVLDEIQTMYNSLESAKMPPSTLAVWSQNRKNRRVILGTSQRFSRVAKGLREQTKYHIECKKPFLWFYRYRLLDGYKYNEDGKYELEEDEKMPPFQWYVPNFKVMTMYNTLEVIRNNESNV